MHARREAIACPSRKVLVALVAALFAAPLAFGNPVGPAVVSGSASFATVGKTLTVTNTPSAIINWRGFSIGTGETTRFQQQSAASAVLNRVVGQDPSAILGTLSSNGRVFLLNPNGIVFGAGSRVDVAGLVASTLNLSNQDFLAGRLNFEAGAVANPILNHGNIATPAGGRVYLIAPNVENHGVISTPQGQTILAAGKSVQLVEADVPNLRVEVQAGGEALNVGQILAAGGSAGIYAGLINQRGVVRADSVSRDAAGRIVFHASGTTILDSGSVTSASGAKGGTIQVLGNRVGLVGDARVDASGEQGGGTVLVGGDYQGRNPDVPNASRTYVGPDAAIAADAISSGDGGKVVVWANDVARVHGTIRARGGESGGNGGFVETSGKNALDVRGIKVDAGAPAGATGTWLLDPKNIEVVNLGGATLPDVDQFADSPLATLQIAPATINGAGTNVVLQAENDITFTDAVSIAAPSVTLTGQAGRSILVNANISTHNADITLRANDPAAPGTNREAGNGGIFMAPTATISAGTGKVTLQVGSGPGGAAGGDIVAANISAMNVELQQNSPTNGSSILRTSPTSLLSGTNLLLEVDHSGTASGGSIGTSLAPMRVQVATLEAHTHEASPGIFVESPNAGNLQIGGVSFFGGVVKGVQNVTSGDITIRVNGTLTTQAGTPAVTCGGGATGGPICTGGSAITLNANDMSVGNSVNAGAGTAALAPFSTNRDITIGIGTGTLQLSAAELQSITANVLDIGRTSDTGTLTVAIALTSSDLNPGLLVLRHQNVAINQPLTFSTDSETLNLAHGAGGSITIGANISVGTGQIDATSQTVNFSGSPTLTSSNAISGFATGTANVSGGTVTLNAKSALGTLNLSGGTLGGAGVVTINGGFNYSSGNVNGALVLGPSTSTNLSGVTVAGSGTVTNQGVLTLSGSTINPLVNNQGTLVSTGASSLNGSPMNSGTVNVNSGTLGIGSTYNHNGGTTTVAAGAILATSSVTLSGGSLKGAGTITGSVNNTGGTLAAGTSVGALAITGNYTQSAAGTMQVEIGGSAPGLFDVVNVTGMATLNGTLALFVLPGAVVAPGAPMKFLTASSISGTFATMTQSLGASFGLTYGLTGVEAAGIVATTAPSVPPPPPQVLPPPPDPPPPPPGDSDADDTPTPTAEGTSTPAAEDDSGSTRKRRVPRCG